MLSYTHSRPAQSLLEGILAIAVIVIATLSSMTLIVTTITVGQSSADKIQATNLAREGVEVVRAIRDSNWMKRAQNIDDDGDGVPGCTPPSCNTVQWDDTGLITDGHAPLNGNYIATFDPTTGWSLTVAPADRKIYTFNGYFSHCLVALCGVPATKYSRTISISGLLDNIFSVGDAPYLLVTSTITWNNHGAKTLAVSERLYDWR